MKKEIVITLVLFFGYCMNAFAAEGRVRFVPENPKLTPGDNLRLELHAEGLPAVYGMEMILSYDPDLLSLPDAEPEAEGIQIEPGAFFVHDSPYFLLQNRVMENTGRISYAVSLLNPAPAAEGNGILAAVNLVAKKKGEARIRIEKLGFGTRDGKSVDPVYAESIPITVRGPLVHFLFSPDGIAIGIFLFILIALGFLLSVKQIQVSQPS